MPSHHAARRGLALTAAIIAVMTLAPSARAQTFRAPVDEEEYCHAHWWGVGRCWNRPHRHPVFTAGFELGVTKLAEGGPFGFDTSVGSVTSAGPFYGLRAGVDVLSWLGFEGRYVGAYIPGSGSVTTGGNVGYAMNGGEAVLRLTIPFPFVRPYIFGGMGVYDLALVGSSAAQAASTLQSSGQWGVPVGAGLELMLSWHVTFALEAAFRYLYGEVFSTNDKIDGGDLSSLTGVMRFRF